MSKQFVRMTSMAAAFAKAGLVETHPRAFVMQSPVAYPAKYHVGKSGTPLTRQPVETTDAGTEAARTA